MDERYAVRTPLSHSRVLSAPYDRRLALALESVPLTTVLATTNILEFDSHASGEDSAACRPTRQCFVKPPARIASLSTCGYVSPS
jgi:hypothetical protein